MPRAQTPKKFECPACSARHTERMNFQMANQPRKVRLLPGLRLELCQHGTAVQLTPDEALAMANSLILNAREGLHQAGKNATPARPQSPALSASATPDGATVALWCQGIESVATLTPDQSQALANTLQSKASRIKIGCAIDHFSAP